MIKSFDVDLIGIGPQADPEMMEAVTGQVPAQVWERARLLGHQLGIQALDETEALVAQPSTKSSIPFVTAYTFAHPEQAVEAASNWNQEVLGWSFMSSVRALLQSGEFVSGPAEVLPTEQPTVPVHDPIRQPRFLVPKPKMIRRAKLVHAAFLKDN